MADPPPYVAQRAIGRHTVTLLLPPLGSQLCVHDLRELAAFLRGFADSIDAGIAMATRLVEQRRGPPS